MHASSLVNQLIGTGSDVHKLLFYLTHSLPKILLALNVFQNDSNTCDYGASERRYLEQR